VQPHVQPLASQELARPHLVEENEGAEDLPLRGREGASHLEAADIVGWWQDHAFHAGRHRPVRTVLAAHLVYPSNQAEMASISPCDKSRPAGNVRREIPCPRR
jgi:hypothetical protein